MYYPWEILQQKYRTYSDGRRVENLEKCQVLHRLFVQCQQRKQQQQRSLQSQQESVSGSGTEAQITSANRTLTTTTAESAATATSAELTTIDTVPAGIRILRMFRWNNVELPDEIMDSCRREEHALWTCRAFAMACGSALLDVKNCFDRTGPVEVLKHDAVYQYPHSHPQEPSALTTTASTKTQKPSCSTSDSTTTTSTSTNTTTPIMIPPCAHVQRAMALCVTQGVNNLLDRRTAAAAAARKEP